MLLRDIHTKVYTEGLWDKIFDTEMVAALGRALSDEDYFVRMSVLHAFTGVMAQGALRFFLLGIPTKTYAEGFRDKIFDTEIVAAVGRALGDRSSGVRSSAVKIFTAAMAQGALRHFYSIFVPKYRQRGFGTRYLTLRWSPHLDVH